MKERKLTKDIQMATTLSDIAMMLSSCELDTMLDDGKDYANLCDVGRNAWLIFISYSYSVVWYNQA